MGFEVALELPEPVDGSYGLDVAFGKYEPVVRCVECAVEVLAGEAGGGQAAGADGLVSRGGAVDGGGEGVGGAVHLIS
ncbi:MULTISPECIES: hypothetical protein [unclassified Streptomyces]|uniref:hypothetical protein n=1 Tax=unclassified Streptomyces TaxID=2593676 RepID=UPI00386B500D